MLKNFLHQIFYNLEGFGLLLRAIFEKIVIFVFLFMSYLCTRMRQAYKAGILNTGYGAGNLRKLASDEIP